MNFIQYTTSAREREALKGAGGAPKTAFPFGGNCGILVKNGRGCPDLSYDFTTLVDRRYSGSEKWAPVVERYPDGGPELCPFSTADMEFRTAPEIAWALKKAVDEEILGYTSANRPYFDTVRGWMQRRHGFAVREEWILPWNGVVPGLFACVEAFCEPGDGVLCLTPVYAPFYMAVRARGCELLESELRLDGEGKYRIDFQDFENKAGKAKLLLLCSPHNPGGRVWTLEELREIGRICLEKGLTVVSDEIHADLVLPGFRHTVFPLACPEMRDRCVVCTAPSKSFNLAGLQTSNLIVEGGELRKKLRGHLCGDLTILGYRACQAAYDRAGPWLDQCLEVIAENHRVLSDFFAEVLPACRATPVEGTYLGWVDMRPLGLGHGDLLEALRREAAFFPSDGAWFGPGGEGFIRVNVACPTWALQRALGRLKKAVEEGRIRA